MASFVNFSTTFIIIIIILVVVFYEINFVS